MSSKDRRVAKLSKNKGGKTSNKERKKQQCQAGSGRGRTTLNKYRGTTTSSKDKWASTLSKDKRTIVSNKEWKINDIEWGTKEQQCWARTRGLATLNEDRKATTSSKDKGAIVLSK